MTKHITVGYDASPESSEALDWAALECEARRSALSIVTSYRLPVAGDIQTGWIPTEAYSGAAQTANAELERALEATRAAHPTLDIDSRLVAGSAATVLIEDEASGQELIVVGASSHKGASAFWLGSTPRSLVRHAPCPVVVVRGASSRGRPDRVVVAVDGSEGARRAMEWALAEANLHHVPIGVVHAWEYPYTLPDTPKSQARDLTRVDAACVLDEAIAYLREDAHGAVEGNLVEGSAASAVLDAVVDGDLLVLGSRGRGALRAGVFGSTVNSVLDRAVVPVAVVR
jgi:nucleotide-binding universal stress UspA family protein